MRHFMRHPASMPIEVSALHSELQALSHLCNVSIGGLAFEAAQEVEAGSIISLRIPCVVPVFESVAKVAWCRELDSGYELGVEFLDQDDAYRARMIEQVCHIEEYREQVRQTEQRDAIRQRGAGLPVTSHHRAQRHRLCGGATQGIHRLESHRQAGMAGRARRQHRQARRFARTPGKQRPAGQR